MTARNFTFTQHVTLNKSMCRGCGFSVTTCSPPLSCGATSLFRIVTFLSSLAPHSDVFLSARSSHVPAPSAFRQASFLRLRTPDHHRLSTRGCLAHDGSIRMSMTVRFRTLDCSQHCLAASRVPYNCNCASRHTTSITTKKAQKAQL